MTDTPDLSPPADSLVAVSNRAAFILDEVAKMPNGQAITVLGASKTQPLPKILAAIDGGIRVFGENFLQDALEKIPAVEPDVGIEWHFIGHVQSNKTRAIAQTFDWVQTVDRVRIAKRLNEARETSHNPLNVCIEVNVDKEPQKSGLAPEEVNDFVHEIEGLPNLAIRGLMAIPAPHEDPEYMRPAFQRLRDIFDRATVLDKAKWNVLSMGMSHDYIVAIQEGATLIRVGTALFGPRAIL